jgi:ubiquitin-protein ligase E3 C
MWEHEDVFDGPGRRSNVNLSTNNASSSSSLLSTVKKERLAREERRRHERAAVTIQRIWRGRREYVQARRDIIEDIGQEWDVAVKARGLVGLLKVGVGSDAAKVKALMVDWAETAGRADCRSNFGKDGQC